MCNNECVSDGICKHNEECYDDVCLTSEQIKIKERIRIMEKYEMLMRYIKKWRDKQYDKQ